MWENKTASVADDKVSAGLSLQYGERTDEHAEHKLSTWINVVPQHYTPFGLKGHGSLMVIICGDRLPLLDVIAPCWCAGEGDSAFPHTGSQLCWSLISQLPTLSN